MPRAAVRAHSESLVEFEIARPPAPRLGEIAGIEFQLGEIEDGVGIVGVERDRLAADAGAPLGAPALASSARPD